MNVHKILITVIFLATLIFAKESIASIDDKPEVGKPCPKFTLSYVTHYPKKQVSLDDFKGQWLFLDFWFTGCSACIKSFPKISALQSEFTGKVQFLLVGYNAKKTEKNIEETFEKLRVKQGLNIATAYDSILAHQWGVRSMPHIVVIDPQGIVRSITDGQNMTKEKIQSILSGGPVSFFQKEGMVRPAFEGNLAGYKGANFPEEKILNHSVLTRWNGEDPNGGYDLGEYVTFPPSEWEKGFKFAGVTPEWLYCTAYLGKNPGFLKFWREPLYGQVYPFPVLELQNSKPLESKYDGYDSLYNYSLRIPSSQVTKENIMKYMQQDLERVFGYRAFVEERDMPVWQLVAKSGAEAKIKTKGGPLYYDGQEGKSIAAGFTVRNVAMKDYIMYLCYYLNEKEKHPFIDATGIKSNIDLTIDADLTNLEDVRTALQKNGLDLVKSSKKMKVLVIKDK